jgi:hypothetical protein
MAQTYTLPPPGRALIEACPDCHGARCRHCQWKGRILWHVCPRCGNIDWRYIAGHNDDRQGMYCRLGCGAQWMPDDPDWLAQRLPDD